MEKRLEHMIESLTACVENQFTQLDKVDTKEMGEAIDMIKDLEEALYYCTITKAMKEKEKEEYRSYYPVYMRDMDRDYGRMYYNDGNGYSSNTNNNSNSQYSNGNGNNSSQSSNEGNSSTMQYRDSGRGSANQYGRSGMSQFMEPEYKMMRDAREGKSPYSRKSYMESKAQHSDKAVQMKELETYMQELTSDIVEMVEGSSQEEKQYLSKRVAALANKISQLND